jgi:hypothetical protein
MTWYEDLAVTVPEGGLEGIVVERFVVPERSLENLRLRLQGGRDTRPGTYTRLLDGRRIWMSDTDAERRDHIEPYLKIREPSTRRVLINGLGLGMIVRAALRFDHVEHVDVVERDPRIVKLIGRHYTQDPRVTIHEADAYEQAKRWPAGTHWDVGWSDIWPDLCTDNLEDMARLRRSYARRCGWHDCWGRELLRHRRRQEAGMWWNR